MTSENRMRAELVLLNSKRDMVNRLLAAWLAVPDQRLGQLLVNACAARCKSPLFWAEDVVLIEALEEYAESRRKFWP